MKKEINKKNKYFVYAYALDLDEQMPPFSGRVSYDEYDDLEKAKSAVMCTELSRFAGFEVVLLQVKTPKSKLDDIHDNEYSITINQGLAASHKAKLDQFFQTRAQEQYEEAQKAAKKAQQEKDKQELAKKHCSAKSCR